MICLDGTEKDAIVLQHLALLKHNLNIKTIYFFHVIKRSLVPESISRLFSDYQEEGKEVEKSIIELIKNEWAFSTLHYEVVIEKGRLLEKTLQAIKKYNIDLLLLGRNTEDNLDYTNQKIASLAHCSVLFIPHVRSDKYHKIVVPIDFSENSKIALRRVLWQKERNPNL